MGGGGSSELIASDNNEMEAEEICKLSHRGAALVEADKGAIGGIWAWGDGDETGEKSGGTRPMGLDVERGSKAGGADVCHKTERIGGVDISAIALPREEDGSGNCEVGNVVELFAIAWRLLLQL